MSSVNYDTLPDGNTVTQRLRNYSAVVGFADEQEDVSRDVTVHMASRSHPLWNFVDDGDEIELYVIFAEGVNGNPWPDGASSSRVGEFAFKVELAGEIRRLEPIVCLKRRHSQLFKATAIVGMHGQLRAGEPVPFSVEYYDLQGNRQEVNTVTAPNRPVYYQPVWKDLNERDNSLKQEIARLEESPEVSGPTEEDSILRQDTLQRHFSRPNTPVQLAEDDFFLHYTRKACSGFLTSDNALVKIVRELMVTPLTNFTGLSLFYQLYLVEIFHVKFFTKAGHYLCMPMIVLLMATWFAQWRFVGYYQVQDFSIFIVNGTLIFVLALQAWYLLWGCLYRMFLFGAFMIWPLFVMYILANMMFQMIVINSLWIRDSQITVNDVIERWGQNSSHWYDFITLSHFGVVWYFHPLLWALVISSFQALSHLFEEKLPPRVSQTAHWLDITTILKQRGFVATSLICVSQFIFGTLNEFCASPRLLPVLVLRITYTMGYEELVWLKFRLLVEECLKYGDPAIDYIGQGGADMPRRFEEFRPEKMADELNAIERGLTKKEKDGLKDPAFLKDPGRFTTTLKYYVLLRHRLTKYRIQVNAYGPFTPKKDYNQGPDDMRKMNDFPDHPGFQLFLDEVRTHFAEMEWDFVNQCKLHRL